MFYAGIGSRKTPAKVCSFFSRLSVRLSEIGFIVRSGGADGADIAFTKLVAPNCEIYLPGLVEDNAMVMASQFHPAWDRCSYYVKRLHARNCYQILGDDLKTPSMFVACWTPDGAEKETTRDTGGTGQAIRLAVANNIPVFNFRNEKAMERLHKFLLERGVV